MMAGIRGLRCANPSDAAAVRDLTRVAYAKWISLIGREPLPMTVDHAAAIRDHVVELLEDDAGLGALIEMIPSADHLLIENVAVRPDLQGRGIASFLLSHAEDTARRLGLVEVRLYTNGVFAENVGFYLRRGYVETSRRPLPDGGTVVHFAKAVS